MSQERHRSRSTVRHSFGNGSVRLGRGVVGAVAAAALVFLGSLGGSYRRAREAEAVDRAAGQVVAAAQAIDRELSAVAVDLAAYNSALDAGAPPTKAAANLSAALSAMRSERGAEVVFEAASDNTPSSSLEQLAVQRSEGVVLIGPTEVIYTAARGDVTTRVSLDLSHVVSRHGVELQLIGPGSGPGVAGTETVHASEWLDEARLRGWAIVPNETSEEVRAAATTAHSISVVASTMPASAPLLWSIVFWILASLLAGAVAWSCAGYRKKPNETDGPGRPLLEATVQLVRETAGASDLETVIEALERALNQAFSGPEWYVLSASSIRSGDVEKARFPAEELQRALSEAERLTGQDPSALTQAIASPALAKAGRMLFIVRDVSEVYGVAVAHDYDVQQHLAGGAELLLRVAAASLRSVSLLRRLVSSEQEAAVGRLAAGIAHEVNNPLAYVSMNLETLRDGTSGELRSTATEALEGVDRIEQVIRGIRVLFRGAEELVLQDIDLTSLAEKTARIASARQVGTPIEVIADEPLTVHGDEVGLGQTLLNLMTNAVDAVRDYPNPGIVVHLQRIDDDVVVDVEDNGPGVAEPMQSRLFEAFVSGKGKRGTGLGLGIARSFANAHGGSLRLKATGPWGSIFRLTLPASPKKVAAAFRSSPAPSPKKPTVQRESHQRPEILIIDDEAPLVRALGRWLHDSAAVTGSTSPDEGLELAATRGFSLILCDLNMPGMSGLEIVEALEQRAPNAAERLVIMTGSVDAQLPGRKVVTKPISRDTVLDLLDSMP